MNTEGASWIKDKVFVIVARSVIAAALVYPLTHFRSVWFWVLAGLALASFWTRGPMYVSMGGNPREYTKALGSLFIAFLAYGLLVQGADVTPCTWTRWTDFLTRVEAAQCRD